MGNPWNADGSGVNWEIPGTLIDPSTSAPLLILPICSQISTLGRWIGLDPARIWREFRGNSGEHSQLSRIFLQVNVPWNFPSPEHSQLSWILLKVNIPWNLPSPGEHSQLPSLAPSLESFPANLNPAVPQQQQQQNLCNPCFFPLKSGIFPIPRKQKVPHPGK